MGRRGDHGATAALWPLPLFAETRPEEKRGFKPSDYAASKVQEQDAAASGKTASSLIFCVLLEINSLHSGSHVCGRTGQVGREEKKEDKPRAEKRVICRVFSLPCRQRWLQRSPRSAGAAPPAARCRLPGDRQMATAPSPRAAAPILPTKVITSSENSQLDISRSRKKKESKGKGTKGVKRHPSLPARRIEGAFSSCSARWFCPWQTAPESPGCWRGPRDAQSKSRHMLPARRPASGSQPPPRPSRTDRSRGEPPKSAGGSSSSNRRCHSAGRHRDDFRLSASPASLGRYPQPQKATPAKLYWALGNNPSDSVPGSGREAVKVLLCRPLKL